MSNKIELSVFYFPNFHKGDKHNTNWHGPEWTEWNLLKEAKPRFKGHKIYQPLDGYLDESNPLVMEKKIKQMKFANITNVLFDWYWYEDGPFLNDCLDKGFLKAKNNKDIKFSLMWANHNWLDIHPLPLAYFNDQKLELAGKISEKAFDNAFEYIIKNYFSHDNYYRVDGRLFFSIYEINKFVETLGGLDQAKKKIEEIRNKIRSAGLGELHLNAIVWGCRILQGESESTINGKSLKELGFDSVTSYVWIHEHVVPEFPAYDYEKMVEDVKDDFYRLSKTYEGLPYYPNITTGWDPSPRANQTDDFVNVGYPFMSTLSNNTPAALMKACQMIKNQVLNSNLENKIITINAWNEWTEGSYLEPDTKYKYKKLKVLRDCFKD